MTNLQAAWIVFVLSVLAGGMGGLVFLKSDSNSLKPPSAHQSLHNDVISASFQTTNPGQVDTNRKVLKNMKGTGVDALIIKSETEYVIEFSKPVSFAWVILANNPNNVIMRAYDKHGNLIDKDFGISELVAFGGQIVKLVIVGAKGKIKELTFVPPKE